MKRFSKVLYLTILMMIVFFTLGFGMLQAASVTGTVVINDGDDYTVSPRIMLTLNSSNAAYMYISEANVKPSLDSNEWHDYSTKMPYEFGSNAGDKTVYVWFKDLDGNVSEVHYDSIVLDYNAAIPAHDSVMLDRTQIDKKAPIILKEKYNGNQAEVTLDFRQQDTMVNSIRSGVDNNTIEYGYKKSSDSSYTWSKSPQITNLLSDTSYNFKTRAKDRAGNGPTESEVFTKKLDKPIVEIKDKDVQYDGNVKEIDPAEINIENVGNIEYKYFVDSNLLNPTTKDRDGSENSGGAPVKPGVYYVQAEYTDDNNNVTSNVAVLRVGWFIEKDDSVTERIFSYVERTSPDRDEFILNVIGNGVMHDLSSLKKKNNNETYVYWADYKTKIIELNIGISGSDSIENIGSEVFSDLTGITNISIPNSVEKIGDYAFKGCLGVTNTINISSAVNEVGAGAYAYVNTPAFSVNRLNSVFYTIDGVLANTVSKKVNGVETGEEIKQLVAYPNGKGTTKYTIPSELKVVKAAAFMGANNLTGVVIPDGFEMIEEKGFYDCSNLKIVEIEDLMRDTNQDFVYVGNNAFVNIAQDSIVYTFSKKVADKFTAGKTHTSVVTEIYWPPVITLHPLDTNGVVGNSVTFKVEATAGYPKPMEFQWFRVANAIETPASGAVNSVYTTGNLDNSNDNDYYYCRVYNAQYYYDRGFVNSNKAKVTMIDANYVLLRGETDRYYYAKLQSAFDASMSGDIIKPLKDVSNEENAELSGKRSVRLDLDGKTIGMLGTISLNDESCLNVEGSGAINKSGGYVIEVRSKLILDGTFEIKNTSSNGIMVYDDATLDVKSGTITSTGHAIHAQNGIVKVEGENANIVSNPNSQTAFTEDAEGNDYACTVLLYGKTKFDMSKGSIKAEKTSTTSYGSIYGIYVNGSSDSTTNRTTNIIGGTISATSQGGDAYGIANVGKTQVIINEPAKIEGSKGGIVTAKDGGNIVVNSGTVIGGYYGILNNSEIAKITIGEKGDNVTDTAPIIVGEEVAIFNVKKNNTLEFYDGSLYSHSENIIYEGYNSNVVTVPSGITAHIYTHPSRGDIVVEEGYIIEVDENIEYEHTNGYNRAYLIQNIPPIVSGPDDQKVKEGEKATFKVIATGGKPDVYTYKWEVSFDNGKSWIDVNTGTGMNSAEYTTSIVSATMHGYKYRCAVSNGKNLVYSAIAKLEVETNYDANIQRPIVRIIFPEGRKINTDGEGKYVKLQAVVKSFTELESVKVNTKEIFGQNYYKFTDGSIEITSASNNPIVIKQNIGGEEKDSEFTYTYDLKVYRNDTITVEVRDKKRDYKDTPRDNKETQIVDLLFDLKVYNPIFSELTQSSENLYLTFYANKPVVPTRATDASGESSLYLDMVGLDNAEYSYRYSLKLTNPMPTTRFFFKDEYGNQAYDEEGKHPYVEVNEINRVRYKKIKFNSGTSEMNDLTIIDAYNIAQNLENLTETNGNEELQTRYGINSVQSDMFMSRARDIGAMGILSTASHSKSYDGVFTTNMKNVVSEHNSAYDCVDTTSNLFVSAAAKNAVDNKLSTRENRKYVDVISKDVSLYKGMNISGFEIEDASPYMYMKPSGASNLAETDVVKASFRTTIIAK